VFCATFFCVDSREEEEERREDGAQAIKNIEAKTGKISSCERKKALRSREGKI
jgi:hypothetical protein